MIYQEGYVLSGTYFITYLPEELFANTILIWSDIFKFVMHF